jgi:carnosine N-methyltransferase
MMMMSHHSFPPCNFHFRTSRKEEFEIYPWIHSFSNHERSENITATVRVPDVQPGGIPETTDFSMVAGDFTEIYSDPSHFEQWDAVTACFFLDTAHNILEYLETISRILKPGGLLLHLGPLLYHFEGMAREPSVELTLEELEGAMEHYGLEFLYSKKTRVVSSYAGHPESLLRPMYNSPFWVLRKKKK